MHLPLSTAWALGPHAAVLLPAGPSPPGWQVWPEGWEGQFVTQGSDVQSDASHGNDSSGTYLFLPSQLAKGVCFHQHPNGCVYVYIYTYILKTHI